LPFERLLPQFPLIIQDLAFAFQHPFWVLHKDVPHGKIIETLLTTKPLEMLPRFPVPISGIVVLIAGPIFTAAFDCDFLKIVNGNPAVILEECFQCSRLDEMQACPVCRSLFGWWQWHLFDFVCAL
jgi:hypothetical protein